MDNTSDSTTNPRPDGRMMRSERSRQLIVNALLSLVEDGNLVPTAQQVAERADVGIRTVFRHFEDMESLYQTGDDLIRHTYEDMFIGGDRQGNLEQRISRAIERRVDAYEKLSKICLSSQTQYWRSPVIRKNCARNQRGLRKDLNDWLPELAHTPSAQREAIDGITSFEFWHRLHELQQLPREQIIATICTALKALVQSV